jgi:hypothetical protein
LSIPFAVQAAPQFLAGVLEYNEKEALKKKDGPEEKKRN